ncbi:MAG TPA: hypothetical protein VGE30_00240 [Candidatus Saccharimonadales bacterium]
MSDILIALFIAAGVAGLAYSKLGRRVGYANSANVWTLVAVAFVLAFLVVLILVNTLISLD